MSDVVSAWEDVVLEASYHPWATVFGSQLHPLPESCSDGQLLLKRQAELRTMLRDGEISRATYEIGQAGTDQVLSGRCVLGLNADPIYGIQMAHSLGHRISEWEDNHDRFVARLLGFCADGLGISLVFRFHTHDEFNTYCQWLMAALKEATTLVKHNQSQPEAGF